MGGPMDTSQPAPRHTLKKHDRPKSMALSCACGSVLASRKFSGFRSCGPGGVGGVCSAKGGLVTTSVWTEPLGQSTASVFGSQCLAKASGQGAREAVPPRQRPSRAAACRAPTPQHAADHAWQETAAAQHSAHQYKYVDGG